MGKKEKISDDTVSGINVRIIRKPIKNIYLRIYPPDGRVVLSVPVRTGDRRIRDFLDAKKNWIILNREKIRNKPYPIEKEYISGDTIRFEGKDFRLVLKEAEDKASVRKEESNIIMIVPSGADREIRIKLLYSWYRHEMQKKIPGFISKWERITGLEVVEFGIRNMKTRWGSCIISKKKIWLNLELAKYPDQVLEYIIVHEILHLIEKGHNARFYALFDRYMPEWKEYRKYLKENQYH